jgi:hypothetical protein
MVPLILFISLSCLPLWAQVDSTFHIYLMFGQSNMEGAGTIEAQDRVTNARVLMMQDLTCTNLSREYGRWYTAAPPLNRCWSGLGPGNSFGRMLGEQAPDSITIGLINASVSGCNIFIYKKGCPDGLDEISKGIPFDCGYTWLLDLAKRAQQSGVIKGILFHQGETNTADPNWKYTVQQIVKDLKADLGLGDIPFLAGELLYAKYSSCCSAHNAEIAKLPSLIPNAHVISAWELPGADVAHFTSSSYRTLGERYARKMLQLVYGICDSTVLEPWYATGEAAAVQGDSVHLETGANLVLSPRPANALGYWSWSGDGIFGYKRELTINTSTAGTILPVLKYTNECGAVSHLTYHVQVLDATPTQIPGLTGEGIRETLVSAFPNPAGQVVYLYAPLFVSKAGIRQIRVYNTAGQVLRQFADFPVNGSITLDVHDFSPGSYTFTITGANEFLTGRFNK